jgi:hypothetical protein
MSQSYETIPGTGGQQVSPVPTWSCDAAGCPEHTPVLHDPAGASRGRPLSAIEDGWWEHQGTHLCPGHNPDRGA